MPRFAVCMHVVVDPHLMEDEPWAGWAGSDGGHTGLITAYEQDKPGTEERAQGVPTRHYGRGKEVEV